ncbi:MAG: MFS transporter [Ignavibacteria bacterium]|nr:MFS transporter [Ignavibacteria bacterium]
MEEPQLIQKEKLLTKNFLFVCIANFCMFFAFYMILPAMPVYLLLEFNASKSLIGLILSSYTIATLIIRPFSGFFADTLPRKPLYMLAFFLFVGNFAGYLFATSLLLITIIRITHGLTYGVVTTASSTLAIDVMPSSRRGEGIGYFGATSTMAMALGPMVGLFFAESHSFNIVFGISIAFGIIGLILASFIKVGKRPPISKAPISLDRFLLLKATTPAIVLILFAFLYGHLITYIALFGKEVGINSGTGLFFTLYSIGLIASRFNSGKFIDKGYITQLILIGNAMIVVSFTIFVLADNVYLFYGIAAFIGLGFGISSPAYQTLFLNLAENNQRGTANSTYLMSWDIGTGLGVLIGGYVAEWSSYHTAYGIAIILAIMSIVLFWKVSIPYFNKHRLK